MVINDFKDLALADELTLRQLESEWQVVDSSKTCIRCLESTREEADSNSQNFEITDSFCCA
ncbi:MAG: hypothetical protein ACRC56_09020, partial [Bosea sp. (in: a-proteobacteria)]